MMDLKKEIVEVLSRFYPREDIEKTVRKPDSPQHGYYTSTLAFQVSTGEKKDPRGIAEELAEKIKPSKIIQKVEAVNGYLNFFLNWREVSKFVFSEISSKKGRYGEVNLGKGEKVLLEHTSANPNKPLHVGILRNTCLGDALAMIMKFTGYNVTVVNYIDDSGVQVAYNVLAHTELGFPLQSKKKEKFDHYCGKVYSQVFKIVEEKPEFEKKLREIIAKIEEGNNTYSKFARELAEKVVKSQLETCWRIKVYFNYLIWETDILKSGLWEKAFNELKETGKIIKKNEGEKKGCWILDLSKDPFFSKQKDAEEVLVRSDGTSVYVAKDIAFAMWKLNCLREKHKFFIKEFCLQPNKVSLFTTVPRETGKYLWSDADYTIAVIGSEQKHAQRVVKTSLNLIGCKKKYLHYSYGLLTLSRETVEELLENEQKERKDLKKAVKMSGRKGLVVNADDVLDELKKLTRIETRRRNRDEPDEWVEEKAEEVAVGALKFELLKTSREKWVVFDIKKALELKENTGPYIQYTYARANRIIEKAKEQEIEESNEFEELKDVEKEVLKKLYEFPSIVKKAGETLSPQVICQFLTELSLTFNKFYQNIPVLKAEKGGNKRFRLELVKGVKQVLENGLNLLGIPAPEKM